MLIEHHPSHLN
jgi:hypothetical protein